MADLFDRIVSDPDRETPKVSGHYLPGMMVAYHNPNGRTSSQIKTFFNMDVDAIADFDIITAHFDGLTNIQKVEFLWNMYAASVLIELGDITTKTQYAAFLGI